MAITQKNEVRITILAILIMFLTLTSGCSINKKDNESDEEKKQNEMLETLEVNSSGQMKHEGVTFSFIITEEGAIINQVTPDSGKNLVFPEKIGKYPVVDVDEYCKMQYETIKFSGLKTEPAYYNKVTSEITFYNNAKLETDLCMFLNLKYVSLPTSTQEITQRMFSNLKSLTEVNAECITNVGKEAFSGCESLTTLNANGITHISDGAFKNCSSLSTIDLSKVTDIGNSAFENCSSLTNIDSSYITTIGDGAFKYCTSLSSIDLTNVTSIGDSAFYNCNSLCCDISFNNLNIEDFYPDVFDGCDMLNGKTIYFNVNEGSPNLDFYHQLTDLKYLKDSGINIVSESLTDLQRDFINSRDWWAVAHSGWNSLKGIDYEINGINVTPSEFVNAVYEYFNGKEVKSGESIKIKEISHILNMIKDDGNISYTFLDHRTQEATKYRIVDSLKISLAGIDYDTLVYYDDELKNYIWDNNNIGIPKEYINESGGWGMYKYYNLDDNMELINTSGHDIVFYVVKGTVTDGLTKVDTFDLICFIK